MAFLLQNYRNICHPPELEYDIIRNQAAILSREIYDVYPTNAYTNGDDNTPIEFLISDKSSTDFIDLNSTRLYVRFTCKKNRTDSILLTDKIGLNNAPFHGLWKNVDISFNGHNIVANEDHYGYKAFLKMVQHLPSAKTFESQPLFQRELTSLESGLTTATTVGISMSTPKQLMARSLKIVNGNSIELDSVLKEDVFDIKKLIPNGVDIRIRLNRASPGFILKNSDLTDDPPTDLRVVIEDIKFRVCKVKIEPSYFATFEEKLTKEPLLIKYHKTEIRTHYVDKDSNQLLITDLFPKRIPSKLLITFVNQGVANGDGSDYVFKFNHNDLSSIGVYVNGTPRPCQPLEMDYEAKNEFSEAYNSFVTNTGREASINLPTTDYKECYSIYCFNIDREDDKCFELIRTGCVRIEAKFKNKRQTTLTCLILAYFPTILSIDHLREFKLH
ncbi:MAG: hypothetical protein NZ811_01540 [Gammaproteobacteria bacterium]|nr:hypothetical protein [Gammaproteobacteria bacterium]